MSKIVEMQQPDPVRYDSLILMIFTAEELQRYREQYAESESLTIFDIANTMKADAQEVLNSFDFLDFAEAVLQQADPADRRRRKQHEEQKLLQRL